MLKPQDVPITLLVGVLEDTYKKPSPKSTRQLRDMATNRQIPARQVDGRWVVERGNVPRVAEIIGMVSATAI